MNSFLTLVSLQMNENDRRMLVILLVILTVSFILVGLLGMAIRKVCQLQAGVIDTEMGQVVMYKVVSDPVHFKKLATQKNNRLLVKKAAAPIIIGFVALLFYLIFAGVTDGWGRNYWGEFGTILFTFDFQNATYTDFWGFRHILSNWPPVIAPAPQAAYWPSYVLCPLVVTAVVYYLIVIQGYFSRFVYLRRIGHDIFDMQLKDYKYYDHVGTDPYGRPLNPTVTPVRPTDENQPGRPTPNQNDPTKPNNQ
jgi:hypothetical protein